VSSDQFSPSGDLYSRFEAAPAAPPVRPGELGAPQRFSAWPGVIGVIAIVLGALGAVGGLYGILAPWIVEEIASIMPSGTEDMLDAVRESAPWLVGASIITTGVAALLLAVGVGLVKRRRWAVGTCRAWAVLKMVWVLANTVVGYYVQQASLSAISERTPTAAQMSPEFVDAMVVVGLIIGVAWGWALPVFLLIWLGRGKIKAETSAWA